MVGSQGSFVQKNQPSRSALSGINLGDAMRNRVKITIGN